MEAIVLAGGYGGRMESFALERQKCLLPIEGKPVLGHVMEALVAAFGSVDLKIGIGFKGEQVIDYVNHNKPGKVTVTYVPHLPGTEGWGIYKDMRQFVRGKFVATPGDIIALPNAYEEVIFKFDEYNVDAAMTLSPDLEAADTHGIGRMENPCQKKPDFGK
ncbi:MAG: Nucleotidyl transferase [Candidatus Levybacteria bacterium GW2011_GWA1_39_11]|nr:MAG: Nucleotidyl transferase [Candidatus Levybacteria bacterium GW2011_GWA1_39_11]